MATLDKHKHLVFRFDARVSAARRIQHQPGRVFDTRAESPAPGDMYAAIDTGKTTLRPSRRGRKTLAQTIPIKPPDAVRPCPHRDRRVAA